MLRGLLRNLALIGITLASAGLIARGDRSSARGCRRSMCTGCGAIGSCSLPQAVAARREEPR